MSDGHFQPCAVIPVYNHTRVLADTVACLLGQGLPVILVDDGSDAQCRAVMADIARGSEAVTVITRAVNGGKGAALKEGMAAALRLGFSHGLQIDADGQHDCGDVPRFLAAARASPAALVYGYPIYDHSVPRHRYYGRYACHIWVWINTLSLAIRDSMCGFRVYPLAPGSPVLAETRGQRMDFDIEFIVRWQWRGYPLVPLATRVIYPEQGLSHFRLWRDNLWIVWMHTRLFAGMLVRLPALLARRWRAP